MAAAEETAITVNARPLSIRLPQKFGCKLSLARNWCHKTVPGFIRDSGLGLDFSYFSVQISRHGLAKSFYRSLGLVSVSNI